jgi:hypothetical protein
MTEFYKSVIARALALSCLIGASLIFSSGQVGAQSLRDPTKPPAEAGLAGTAPSGRSSSIEPGAMTIIVRAGRPYLAVGTRLYAQGQKLGQARIERISETEVWLREGGVLRKVSQFSGIQRRTVTPIAASPVCAAKTPQGARAAKASKGSKASSSSNTSPAVVPCADLKP